jgi:hypothetical protein
MEIRLKESGQNVSLKFLAWAMFDITGPFYEQKERERKQQSRFFTMSQVELNRLAILEEIEPICNEAEIANRVLFRNKNVARGKWLLAKIKEGNSVRENETNKLILNEFSRLISASEEAERVRRSLGFKERPYPWDAVKIIDSSISSKLAEIVPLPDAMGGGWQLILSEDGKEVSCSVFSPIIYQDKIIAAEEGDENGERRAAELRMREAYFAAEEEAKRWLGEEDEEEEDEEEDWYV